MQIDDYLLKELVNEGETTHTWIAEQISVKREVIINSLIRELHSDPKIVALFKEDLRAKASVDHPHIGSVFEAVHQAEIYFYTREVLTGRTLQEIINNKETLSPQNITHILKQIAEANIHLESINVASVPLDTNHIYIDEKHLARLVNMAVGGKRDERISNKDKAFLGNAFINLIDSSLPGATRTKSLCDIMADKNREIPITWKQVHELSEKVEKQLKDASTHIGNASDSIVNVNTKKHLAITLAAVAVVLLISLVAVYLYKRPKPTSKREELDSLTSIPAGTFKTPNSGQKRTKAFEIETHEVTIAEYSEFLDYIETHGNAATFKHYKQPDTKTSHTPDDWELYYKAAKKGQIWENKRMSVNCPVVNVDWWDAHAYARWKTRSSSSVMKFELPTADQWQAAIYKSSEPLPQLSPSHWGEVDQASGDVSATKLHGLAGNVSEWCREVLPNHNRSQILPLVLGASYLNGDNGANDKEWVPNKSFRRNDIGFRLVRSQ